MSNTERFDKCEHFNTQFNDRDIHDMREEIDTLYKTVFQGNGTPSIVTQVTKLDHRISTLEEKLDTNFSSMDKEITLKFKNITDIVNERFTHISYQIAQEFEKKRETSEMHWNKKTSTIAAVIAGVCSILSVIVSELLHRAI
jgi:hypothetical protein